MRNLTVRRSQTKTGRWSMADVVSGEIVHTDVEDGIIRLHVETGNGQELMVVRFPAGMLTMKALEAAAAA